MNYTQADYNIDGQQFQWTDGLFSVAIGGIQSNGFREAYFHPLGRLVNKLLTNIVVSINTNCTLKLW